MKRIYTKYGFYFLLGFLIALVIFSNTGKEKFIEPSGSMLKSSSNIVALCFKAPIKFQISCTLLILSNPFIGNTFLLYAFNYYYDLKK